MALVSVKLITLTLWVDWYWDYATVYEFLALFAIAWDFWIYTVALREMASNLKNNIWWKIIDDIPVLFLKHFKSGYPKYPI